MSHRVEHDASLERNWEKGAPPKGLPGLLAWFLAAWAQEVPDALHAPGVWRDWGTQSVGGSRLGSPRYNDAFRSYIEGSPHQTDAREGEDERGAVYVRPIHSALARMARNPDSDDAGLARFLFALACAGGDWRGLLETSWMTPTPLQRYATEGALWRLWEKYEGEPRAREVAA